MSPVVVVTEGRHGVAFLKLLHRTGTDRQNYDTFVSRETNDTQETRIQQHRIDDDIRWLYKTEGGRSKLVKKFRSNVLQFGNDSLTLIVMIDLDREGYDSFESEFNEKHNEHFGGQIRVDSRDSESNAHFQIHDCVVPKGDKPAYQFDLVAFHDDLEAVPGIDEDDESGDDNGGDNSDNGEASGWNRAKHRQKIWNYLTHCPDVCANVRETVL
jgi:hypothetical protein